MGRIAIMAIRTIPALRLRADVHPRNWSRRIRGPAHHVAVLCGHGQQMYIEAIEDLDVHVLESLDAAGCTTWQKIRCGILPQLMPNFASTAIYRFDTNLRDATVLGLVGAGGIGAPSSSP